MQRKFLEDLGIDKEMIDKIMDENSKDIGKAKGDLDTIKADRDALKASLEERDAQLTTLKKAAGDNEELTKQITKLQDDNKAAKAQYESDLANARIDSAIDIALISEGAKNTKAVKALLDRSKVKLDGDAVTGHMEQITALKTAEDSKFLFNITEGSDPQFQGAKPGERGGTPPGSNPDFSKMTYEQVEAYYNSQGSKN